MKLRAHTGPTIVKEMAEKCREAGLNVTIEGTEHVYIEQPGKDTYEMNEEIRKALTKKHGTAFGLKFCRYF